MARPVVWLVVRWVFFLSSSLVVVVDGWCDEWTGLPEKPKALTCGVLWFLHVTKTGGTSAEGLLNHFVRQSNGTWKKTEFVDAKWDRSTTQADDQWGSLHPVLNDEAHPRLIVVQHHRAPGLGEYLLAEVVEPLKAHLRRKGCDLVLTTMLREPVSRTKSGFFYLKGRPPVPFLSSDTLRYFADRVADAQMRYVLYSLRGSENPMSPDADSYRKWVANGTDPSVVQRTNSSERLGVGRSLVGSCCFSFPVGRSLFRSDDVCLASATLTWAPP